MPQTRPVLVWELPVRLFHWAIVALICASWGSAEFDEMDWHIRFGLCSLALILFRLIWGLVGGQSARFSQFIASPRSVIRYLRGAAASREDQAVTHNPAGGWMVAALLLVLSLQVATGLFANDDIASEGPLSHFVQKSLVKKLSVIHAFNFYVLCALAAFHIGAVIFYRVVKGQDLVRPMITGRKILPASIAPPTPGSLYLALLIFGAICGGTWFLSRLGG